MTSRENLYSELSKDPELAELVDAFVAEIPKRIAQITEHAQAQDWEKLGRTAHQLKGAAGSYGFHALTRPALLLEQAATSRDHPESQILQAVSELVELCQRIRSGPAPFPAAAAAASAPPARL